MRSRMKRRLIASDLQLLHRFTLRVTSSERLLRSRPRGRTTKNDGVPHGTWLKACLELSF